MPSSSYPDGGVGGGLKAFFLLVFLFLVFLLVSSSSIAQTDLTPDTPAAVQAAPAQEPQVITIQDNSQNTPIGGNGPSDTNNTVPVTGAVTCTNPYTVQPGDMLSSIAAACNTTVADIRLANPSITNINLIYPGEQLSIPGMGGTTAQTNPLPVTGSNIQEQPTQAAPIQPVPVTGAMPVIPAGIRLQVKGLGFPANKPVNIAIGPQNAGYNVAATGVTDADGNLTTTITVPTSSDPNAPWVVVVATTGKPPIQAMSRPFLIRTNTVTP